LKIDAGHVDFLEATAKEGDFLIIGIHSDSVGYVSSIFSEEYKEYRA
jgi:bifunctional ADP-heptose synthase (sugar kinase/adenylyltransferase)